jgi:hypothetical protein
MALVAKDSGGGDYTPAPEGTHIARCVRAVDLGTQKGSVQFPDAKHKVLLAWELCEELSEFEGKMTPIVVSKRYTLSLHKKAGLRHDLETWRSRPFTAEELAGFDLKKILGAPCMVTIVHAPSQDGSKTYANIKGVSAVPKSMAQACPAAHHELLYYQIEDGVDGVFTKLSPKLRETITQAAEWNTGNGDPLSGGSDDGDPGFGDSEIPF